MRRKLRTWGSIGIMVILTACSMLDESTHTPKISQSPITPEPSESLTVTIESVPVNPTTIQSIPPTITETPTMTPSFQPTILPVFPTATQNTHLTPSPDLSPSQLPETEPSPTASSLMVYETSFTIPTYGYIAALQATGPEDAIYPYPRLDASLVTAPEPVDYKAIVMENEYTTVYILPELGGRIYRWLDKSSGRRLLYENPVIKPTEWGYRGWWLAAGGMEWAFPVEEHGLNEWRPWAYNYSNTGTTASVYVSDTEDRTGLEVGMKIILDRLSPVLKLQPTVTNNTTTAQYYQYWLNAMLALNNNKSSKNTEFIIPASQVQVHSTGDSRLPGEWQWMSWPEYHGINISQYGNWQGWLGFFAPHVSAGYTAVYDHDVDQGVVRIFSPGRPAGTKIFGPGTLPSWLWTDDDSSYIELWSGITSTFAADAILDVGESVSWTEYWYPVHELGGVSVANKIGALYLSKTGENIEIGAAVVDGQAEKLILIQNESPVQTWDVSLGPGQTFSATWSLDANVPLKLSLLDVEDNILLQTILQNAP